VLRCAAHVKISLAAIEPQQRVVESVKFQKFEFVGRRKEVPTGGTSGVSALPLVRLMQQTCPALGTLSLSQSGGGRIQLLLLGRLILHGGFECVYLILEWLQWLHLQFDGVQAAQKWH
jgi:hypothetical protein